ncbi:MAG TPA: hypothetical protein VD968_17720 [Pyrinomonadaceae bacterium]|nr:hypothetical protein [Pyrinomonadaceae bacterium]
MTKRGKGGGRRVEKNWIEWAVFGIGLLLVAGTLGFLIYDGATQSGEPPTVEVRLGEPRPTGHNFTVPVTVFNRGDETAEGVTVEVTLEAGGGAEPERSEFTVAFLPRRASREGWVAFSTDPRSGRLTPRVLGYEKP